jgi:hypothetical protein
MQECNPDPETGAQNASKSEESEGCFDQKEVSDHNEEDGQVSDDNDVVEEGPLEEDELQVTPSTLRSGLLEGDLQFASSDDTLGNPQEEEPM